MDFFSNLDSIAEFYVSDVCIYTYIRGSIYIYTWCQGGKKGGTGGDGWGKQTADNIPIHACQMFDILLVIAIEPSIMFKAVVECYLI